MIEQSLAEAPAVVAPSGVRRIMAISASLVSTQALTSVLGLAFWLLAARQFTVAAVGVSGAAISLMSLLGTLGTFGLGTLLIARLPHTPQGVRRVFVRTALAMAGGSALALALLVPLVAIKILHVGSLQAIAGGPGRALLFGIGTALMAVTLVVDQAVLVLGSGSLQLERNAVASGTKLVVLVALSLAGQHGGMTIFAAWTVGLLVSLPALAYRTRGGRPLEAGRRLVDLGSMRGLGRTALSHHALNTTLQAPLQLLPLIILLVLTQHDNGVFTTALQVTGIVFALPYAISVGLFAAAEGDEAEVLDRMGFTIPLGLGISMLANLALFPFAPSVLALFGSNYSTQGANVLRILVLAGIPFVVKDHFVALRRVQNRTGQATLVMIGLSAVELLAAFAGARSHGVVGLCVAWVAVLFLEAALLAVPLLRNSRTRRALGRAVPASTEPLLAAVDTADARAALNAPKTLVGAPLTEDTRPAELLAEPDVDPASEPDLPAQPVRTSLIGRIAAAVGAGPALLLMSTGLLAMAAAVSMARASQDNATAQRLYVLGLVVVVLPAAVGALLPRVRWGNRVALVLGMAVLLQVSRVVLYPTRFMFHDELIHATVLRAIGTTGRLFTDNPLLPITPYYPGLEVATDAVRDLTGLSTHSSAVAVLVAARVVLALGLFGVVEHVTRSTRIGAAAVVVYACNPQMLFFNSQFSYQTLALPLMVFTVYLVLSRRTGSRWSLVTAVLAMAATAFSHHVTTGLLVVALGLWTVLEALLRRGRENQARSLATLTVTGAGLLAATVFNPGNSLAGYLGGIVSSSAQDIATTLGGHQTKKLFQNSAGVGTSTWEEILVIASLALTVLVLAPALLRARRFVRARVSVAVLLSLVALLYPLIPGGHLTRATAEVGDRSAGFLFLGVAFVVGWWLWQRRLRTWQSVAFGVGATVAFVGSVILGAGPFSTQLPGPYQVAADARSVDPANLAAARWEAANLPAGARAYADRDSGLLAGSDGGLFSVTHIGTGIDASRLLLDPAYTTADVKLIRAARIRYLVVDRRDANGLPNQDVYIESGEFGEQGRTTPVPAVALRKFDSVSGVDRVYDNGAITIYDLGVLDAQR